VPPLKIQFALEARDVLLSIPQIKNMCKPIHLQAFVNLSVRLITWVMCNGGRIFTYEERIHDETVRVAGFTQMLDRLRIQHSFQQLKI
jgi:hypothetical protein